MKAMRGRIVGIGAATLAASCSGASTVLSKGALEAMPPIALLVDDGSMPDHLGRVP
jgi:hypothetical protein